MSPLPPPSLSKVSSALNKSLHDHWGLYLAEGLVISLLGLAAIILPALAGLVTTIFLGWIFLVAGIAGLLFTYGARQAPGFGWALLSALLALIVGVVLLWNPLRGVATLTYVLVAYLIFDGILMIILALAHRRELSGKWEWLMVNGVVDLILAVIVISGLPGTLVWVLGLIVGIDMVFGGASLIAMALEARKAALR
jgi:uncharacterized membrane protein HdeD (DUF308 family)